MGTCTDGRCEHSFRDSDCERGCDDNTGVCAGDPCAGVACNTPPNGCYIAQGACESGVCNYVVNPNGSCTDENPCTTGDHCEQSSCCGEPRVCDSPPEPVCLDADTRQYSNPQGVCNPVNGGCEYVTQTQMC